MHALLNAYQTVFPNMRAQCISDINECEEMEQMQHHQQHKCEWKCVNFPGTHRCICPRGYTRHPDGHQCKGWFTPPTPSCVSEGASIFDYFLNFFLYRYR